MSPDPDDDLALRAAADPTAFQALYARYSRRVFGLLGTLGLAPDTADDVAQTAWLRAWQGLTVKPSDSPFGPWLLRIARNAAVDHLRQKRPVSLAVDVVPVDDGGRDALADLQEAEDLARLRACVAKLPDVERQVFQGRLDGLDSPALAAECGLTAARVHRLFHEAKSKVQRCLRVSR